MANFEAENRGRIHTKTTQMSDLQETFREGQNQESIFTFLLRPVSDHRFGKVAGWEICYCRGRTYS